MFSAVRLGLCGVLCLFLSCRHVPATEVLVELSAEPKSTNMARAVRVTITTSEGELRWRHLAYCDDSAGGALPSTVPIVPLHQDASRIFYFTAELLSEPDASAAEGRVFNVYRGIGSFVEHEALHTRVRFTDACTDIFCPVDQSCDRGECVPIRELPAADAQPSAAPSCAEALGRPLSALEQRLIELPADSWLEVPDSQLRAICPDPSGLRGQSASDCASAFYLNSGGYDPQAHELLVFGGDGSNYYGNEVYAFSVERGRWSLRTQPSRPPEGMTPREYFRATDALPDGTPAPRSNFDGVEFLSDQGRLLVVGQSQQPSWWFDPREGSWRADDVLTPRYLGEPAVAYDSSRGVLFRRTPTALDSYALSSRTWQRRAAPSRWGHKSAAIDTRRGLLWVLGGSVSGVPSREVWDLASLSDVSADWETTSGEGEGKEVLHRVYSAQGPGFDYDARADMLVAWVDGAPWRLSLEQKRWTVGSSEGGPPARGRVYGRWRYLREYNVFLLAHSTRENVFFYKNTAGCVP